MWVRDSICAYVLPYHSIFLHTHLGKSGKCRLEPTQTATTSSILCRQQGPIWPKLERHVVLCQHVTTCWRHFQLSHVKKGEITDPLADKVIGAIQTGVTE